jgi:hypothetical protein
MMLKTKLMVVGGSALALLLLGKAASAATDGGGGGTPAPTGARAIVRPNAGRITGTKQDIGMLLRTEPSARGGNATLIAPEGAAPHAFTGQTVEVLQTGIRDADGVTGGEWWLIRTPGGGQGYSRAIDPQGVSNFVMS